MVTVRPASVGNDEVAAAMREKRCLPMPPPPRRGNGGETIPSNDAQCCGRSIAMASYGSWPFHDYKTTQPALCPSDNALPQRAAASSCARSDPMLATRSPICCCSSAPLTKDTAKPSLPASSR
mgnify:CR=1 FL=1